MEHGLNLTDYATASQRRIAVNNRPPASLSASFPQKLCRSANFELHALQMEKHARPRLSSVTTSVQALGRPGPFDVLISTCKLGYIRACNIKNDKFPTWILPESPLPPRRHVDGTSVLTQAQVHVESYISKYASPIYASSQFFLHPRKG